MKKKIIITNNIWVKEHRTTNMKSLYTHQCFIIFVAGMQEKKKFCYKIDLSKIDWIKCWMNFEVVFLGCDY